jgi:hypothetical protein
VWGRAPSPVRAEQGSAGAVTMKKPMSKSVRGGGARKSSPPSLQSDLEVGGRVRVIDIPEDTKDLEADLVSSEAS